MLLSRLNLRRGLWPALLLLVAGCYREQITSYTVKKPELIDPTLAAAAAAAQPRPQQTLGAIVLLEDAGWFFKLSGDPAQVEPQRGAFVNFLKSLQFAGSPEPQPQWDLPEGWSELPGNQFRFATLRLPASAGPLEITVTTLPRGETPAEEYVLANINRWRGQVGQPPISAAELASTTETFKVGEFDTTFVSLVGETTGGGMPGAPFVPFAGGAAAPGSAPSVPDRPTPTAAAGGNETLEFDTPEGWTAGRTTEFRKAAFTVADGEKKVEITVIPLGAGSGTLLENVNRWRGQVMLPPVKEADLATVVKKVESLGVKADYVELVGPAETILGVSAPVGDQVWFIKLSGDSKLAERENARFQAFVKSFKLK